MKTFTLSEVKPKIFLMEFINYYDMAMHFLRYQEFYESPKYRKKSFTIFEFMRWYALNKGDGSFTYPIDWGGFNIPGDIIQQVFHKGIDDINEYDHAMIKVWSECNKKSNGSNFYLIGAVGKKFALKHEIAHGFFYTIPEYKKAATDLVKGLKPSFRKSMEKTLTTMGYDKSVFIDECQAYLATGLVDAFNVKLKDENKPFVKLFNSYNKKL